MSSYIPNTPPQNTTSFQSYLNKARKDKFILVFDLPEVLKRIKTESTRSNDRVIPDTMQFSVYGNIVPDVKIPSVEVPYGGQVMKVSSMVRPSFENNSINFTVDNLYNNYWVIYKWLQIFNDEKKGIYSSPIPADRATLKSYEANLTVFGLDEYNNRVIQFNYYHCFPVSLGGIKFSDRDSDELESSFEFAYHQFEAKLI